MQKICKHPTHFYKTVKYKVGNVPLLLVEATKENVQKKSILRSKQIRSNENYQKNQEGIKPHLSIFK